MKLVKKALAGLCALTMAMTAAASLAVTASAAELPTAYPVITVDEDAKTAQIEVRLKNMPTIAENEYSDPLYMTYVTLQVDVSSFSTETIAGMNARDFSSWKSAHYSSTFASGFAPAVSAANPGYMSYTGLYNSGELAKNAGAAVESDMSLFTVSNIPLSDDALKNGFDVEIRGYNDTNGFQFVVKNEYSDYLAEYKGNANFQTAASEKASWAPSTPPTPTVDWSTATQFGSDYHSDIDNSDAVAYTATLTGDGTEYDTVTWKVTPVEGAAKGCHASANIGGEGTYTIGLVIGDVTSDQITSVEAALGSQGNAQ